MAMEDGRAGALGSRCRDERPARRRQHARAHLRLQGGAGRLRRRVGGDLLADFGATTLKDFARLDPGLQLTTNGVGDNSIILRGVRSTGAATVALYFDEAVITGTTTLDRRDFGMGTSYPDEESVGFAVEVRVNLTALRKAQ